MDTFTLQFHGMERDELEYARDRYRRSARAHRRTLGRLWLRNRAVAVVAVAVLVTIALVIVEGAYVALGRGVLATAAGLGFGLVLLYWAARSSRLAGVAARWQREERDERALYEMDRDSVNAAVRLLRERGWTS